MNDVREAGYSLDFRKSDAILLGDHLRNRHSVDLIGMKRVGISNFLRFFLNHKGIVKAYISKQEQHVFIPVDLNDLVERELFPFWTLTLKRIVDTVDKLNLDRQNKRHIESLFLKAIQSQDLFLAMDSVREALIRIIERGIIPTLFLIRFDRIKDVVTSEFFDNLQGLREATNHQLSYVLTSYRTMEELSPNIFKKNSIPAFIQTMYVNLAPEKDMEIIYKTFNDKYKLKLDKKVKKELLNIVNGHVQYLLSSLIILNESIINLPKTKDELFNLLAHDERIFLQSEELYESLNEIERKVLLDIANNKKTNKKIKKQAAYLWDTGFIVENHDKIKVFSPLLKFYLSELIKKNLTDSQPVHFSKKEHALVQILEQCGKEICEREIIIQSVWPEYSEVGVTDWAIDRLVARVRTKMRQQGSKKEIKTIRTRGYQMIEK